MDRMDKYRGGQRSDLGDRVSNFYKATLGLKEGEDYTVLAYSDYADMLIPTVIRWKDGDTDDFRDLQKSKLSRGRVLRDNFTELTEKEMKILPKIWDAGKGNMDQYGRDTLIDLHRKGVLRITDHSIYPDGALAGGTFVFTDKGISEFTKAKRKSSAVKRI